MYTYLGCCFISCGEDSYQLQVGVQMKTHSASFMELYKAYLVVCGFIQEHIINYDEIFTAIAKITIARTLHVVALFEDVSLSIGCEKCFSS